MGRFLQKFTLSTRASVILVMVVAGIALLLVTSQRASLLGLAREEYINESKVQTTEIAEQVSKSLEVVDKGLSQIAAMPEVRVLNRDGTNLSAPTQRSIREVFFTLTMTLQISEIYFAPISFNPKRFDPRTGTLEEPVVIFDRFGDMRSRGLRKSMMTSSTEDRQKYDITREQVQFFKKHFFKMPSSGDLPISVSREVPNCGFNRASGEKVDGNKDNGVILSVPYYDIHGNLGGVVCATVLSEHISNWFPTENFAIVDRERHLFLHRGLAGEVKESESYARRGKATQERIYSEAIALPMAMGKQTLKLWSQKPDSQYWASPAVGSINQIFLFTCIGISLFAVALVFAVYQNGHRREVQLTNAELERTLVELGASRKMEALGQLSAGIAHEINSPTQFIRDNLSFLQTAVASYNKAIDDLRAWIAHPSVEPAKKLEAANSILNSARLQRVHQETTPAIEECFEGLRRIAEIVRALKDHAHPSGGKYTICDINRIAHNSVIVTRNEWKGVAKVDIDLYDSLPNAWANPGEIGQVVVNLVVNAAHAIQTSKRENGLITVSTHPEKDWIVIEVRDNGIGMRPDQIGKIFEPDYTTKEVGKGTGMGLAITKRIVDQHKGKIEVRSDFGVGTCFKLMIPSEIPDDIYGPNEEAA